jgi:hypothetical protein
MMSLSSNPASTHTMSTQSEPPYNVLNLLSQALYYKSLPIDYIEDLAELGV